MTKKVLLIAVFFISVTINAQKAQRIGYIDMEYILENLPEYTQAQAKINAKAITWQNNLEKQQKEIDDLKTELVNERELLTDDLISEREEDIEIKQLEFKKLQAAYFGTKGDLYFMRQQLVEPIQDLVFNAVQDIAKKRKYDFVLDKSSDLIMLYTNKTYDISDIVITSITRIKKTNEALAKQDQRKKDAASRKQSSKAVPNEAITKKLSDREIKRAELLKEIEAKREAKLKEREALKNAKSAERNSKEDATEEKSVIDETIANETAKKTDTILSAKEAKRIALQKRIEERKAAQAKKREELKKAIEEKRLKRIQEIEDAKKAREEENND
ncbi:OmpH family outer membrane protein [Lutibacter sp. TH_r2]|uniref:OmpH family outer membrane protein n=1 Tax=Lutibacter sp. TH_r2 TaxID=3082083 RepID=UPI002952FE83|nr:OmpH family outer membrane protein [Lutibacter sp. TH_r2]MDV7187881.1 OmpH family outer membrane protein [Lutibacter sp. TH_r2]